MAIKEVAYNLKTTGGYDKYYFETSTNVVLDLEQGKSLKQILTEINGRSTANETRITNNFNQSEYQLPIVVGTQLRLTKSNTSKRFFVQLANTLTGNITISTDSGTTSKPLRDVSGVTVTSLEKGFAEIVEDTAFFTLRNRGLSAADLQALITAVNEAENNANAVRTNLINTINSTEPIINLPSNATFTQAINEIPNIGSTKKKYASGQVTSSANQSTFNYFDNNNNRSFYLAVVPYSEIGFVPSKVELKRYVNPLSTYNTDYYKNILGNIDYASIHYNVTGIASNINSYGVKIGDTPSSYVNSTGFSLPVFGQSTLYSWTAYE